MKLDQTLEYDFPVEFLWELFITGEHLKLVSPNRSGQQVEVTGQGVGMTFKVSWDGQLPNLHTILLLDEENLHIESRIQSLAAVGLADTYASYYFEALSEQRCAVHITYTMDLPEDMNEDDVRNLIVLSIQVFDGNLRQRLSHLHPQRPD